MLNHLTPVVTRPPVLQDLANIVDVEYSYPCECSLRKFWKQLTLALSLTG